MKLNVKAMALTSGLLWGGAVCFATLWLIAFGYEGTVIRIKRGGPRTTFTVRKVSSGIGVERIFPACSPNIAKIEIVGRHKVRRAKLHFLRTRKGKAARLTPIRDFTKSKRIRVRKKKGRKNSEQA